MKPQPLLFNNSSQNSQRANENQHKRKKSKIIFPKVPSASHRPPPPITVKPPSTTTTEPLPESANIQDDRKSLLKRDFLKNWRKRLNNWKLTIEKGFIQHGEVKMWKLKAAEGGNPWLRTVNDHVGRQIWEFDPDLGSPEELMEIEKARLNFTNNRLTNKHSSDLLIRLQFSKENPVLEVLPQVKVEEAENVTEGMVTDTLRRALNFHSSLQVHDGHWPGDYAGPMFLLPGLIITLSITGALNAVLSEEHKKEIRRYLYNHQAISISLMLLFYQV
ncbi:hypothetical protein V6N13_004097 [Hibiscus sabdariffa]